MKKIKKMCIYCRKKKNIIKTYFIIDITNIIFDYFDKHRCFSCNIKKDYLLDGDICNKCVMKTKLAHIIYSKKKSCCYVCGLKTNLFPMRGKPYTYICNIISFPKFVSLYIKLGVFHINYMKNNDKRTHIECKRNCNCHNNLFFN
jgi:hypothetical protein